ncbi:MAG: hypothetical protein V4556_08485 [Bacteroidota bacterium]
MKQLFLFFVIIGFTFSGIAQNVGINTNAPGYPLDVNGRVRLRYNGSFNTAGIWYNNSLNTEAAFTGMFNDTIIGFYGNNNWWVGVDFKNGRLGVGTMTPTAKLDIAGAIKINDGTQAAGKLLTSVDASGKAIWAAPKNSSTGFRAWMPSLPVSSGTVYFPASWNTSSGGGFDEGVFDEQNGIYTAPYTGLYHFEFTIKPDRTQTPTANGYYTITIGSGFTTVATNTIPIIANAVYPDNACSGNIKLNAGDIVRVAVSQNSNTTITFGGGNSVFSGYLVY